MTSLFRLKSSMFVIFALFNLHSFSSVQAGSTPLFRIGAGGQTGVYYPIGKIIAQGLTANNLADNLRKPGENGVAGYIGVAQNSAGSIENIRSIAAGEIEAGLVQADVASWAHRGDHVFKDDETVRGVRPNISGSGEQDRGEISLSGIWSYPG